ncbi:Ser/Thr and Tyr protein phosphatase [Niveibacterium sp. COAC-50]|uniref:Ser/Thr and Tyr protein phosphatase n=1 Tax=Niveibacterium sp. COAC-50 TaxID=2729384 RepID=UPI001551B734|nr:Ser/Thr and Tyr protein phosphatase [Niveibacterium sp. COAC-50]
MVTKEYYPKEKVAAGHSNHAICPGPRWPDLGDLRVFLTWGVVIGMVFFAIYPFCNWLTAQRVEPWRLYLDAELSIPLLPQFVWLYMSMYVLFLLPPLFVPIRTAPLLARQLIAGCVVCGLSYLVFPAVLGFDRGLPSEEPYRQIFGAIFDVDAPHNLVPSMHVVFSCLIALACARFARPCVRYLLWAWLPLIVLSTVLVHQHHLLDVASALLLVLALRWRWRLDQGQSAC